MNGAVPGIPWCAQMLVGAPAAEGELHRVGLAEDDHAGADELLSQRGGDGRTTAAPNRAATGRDAPLELDEVLECDRDTVQRPDRVSSTNGPVGGFRSQPRLLVIDLDKGVKFAVEACDSLQAAGDDLHG